MLLANHPFSKFVTEILASFNGLFSLLSDHYMHMQKINDDVFVGKLFRREEDS